MGTGIVDFNNDELADIVSLDMLPESNYRQKLLKAILTNMIPINCW
jgi:hypothetical protein